MKFNTIRFEEPEEGLGLITLNRPERLNAINLEMLDEMHVLYEQLRVSEKVRVLILTGEGRGFSSGADLTDTKVLEQVSRLFQDPATYLIHVQKKYANLILEMRRLPQPIIAAVKGPAAGGGFCMALASDVVIAAPSAKFVASFINLGLSGGELGSTYFLPRLVGLTRAAEILMTGRTVEAAEAEKMGLVCRVVAEDKLLDSALETARLMLAKSYMGLLQTKEALNQNLTAPNLEAALELENRNQTICIFTPAFRQAVEAFTGKKLST
ncbi:MAG: enoyl-CoA hydratase-related protein [Pseudomonadota bacterium]